MVAGHYYPDPGVTWHALITLLLAPALLILGCIVPTGKTWVRGVMAVLAVLIAVSVITAPAAIAAKKASEADTSDPYP